MAPAASRPRVLAAAALGAVCLNSAFQAASFVGSKAATPTGPRDLASKTQMRVNLFELPNINFGERFDEEESGSRSARVADQRSSRLVECNMPLGIIFEERDGGDIYIKDVDPESDAYDQGVRPGAQLAMISATFGDEMWNAKKVGMTQFMQTLNSRFGSTISLALEKEDKNFISAFFDSLKPKADQKGSTVSKEDLKAQFKAEEERLEIGRAHV